MSKIIEALEKVRSAAGSERFHKKAEPVGAPTQQSKSYQMTQKELADVYFASSAQTKQTPVPTLIRVQDTRKTFLIPWAITMAALLVMCAALLSGKRVMIDIKVMDENQTEQVFRQTPGESNETASSRLNRTGPDPRGTVLLETRNLQFSSEALASSTKNADMAILASDASPSSVYAFMYLNPPFRATDYVLSFEAKGRVGGEILEVVFRDHLYRSSLNNKSIRPFPMGLDTEWQEAQIVSQKSEFFDSDRLTQVRFDIGSKRTGNGPNTAIFLRNLKWKPKTRG